MTQDDNNGRMDKMTDAINRISETIGRIDERTGSMKDNFNLLTSNLEKNYVRREEFDNTVRPLLKNTSKGIWLAIGTLITLLVHIIYTFLKLP